MSKGRLISFEGLDGAGKTTQLELLEDWLKAHHISYVRTREPGGTPLGVEVRNLLLNRPELGITPLAETFLFQADRAQHFAKGVLPALEEGKLVITDRSLDASIAYQGFARGVGEELVEDLSLIATQQRVPDLTILLDLNPVRVHMRTDVTRDQVDETDDKAGIARQLRFPFYSDPTLNQIGLREEQNRFDIETEKFHRRVREGFRSRARSFPERIKVIDASRPIQQIHQEVIALVKPFL